MTISDFGLRQSTRLNRTVTRRQLLTRAAVVSGAMGVGFPFSAPAESLAVLDVAYAGSMGSLMEGPLKKAAASNLKLELHGRGQGANALGQLIASGSITPDVFIPITEGPMRTVFAAGKSTAAQPIARTEMVIAYSPKSRFADRLDAAARGEKPWWKVLQEPGLRFGRSDPTADPQGRNIIFTMMLAAKLYRQSDLVKEVLGETSNSRQITMEASVQSRLQSGELDAASAYKIQPGPFHLPYIKLPAEINLSGADVHATNPEVRLDVGGKTYVPEPLIYYAAVMKEARNPLRAAAFVAWLEGGEAQTLLRQNAYDETGQASVLHA